MTETFNCLELRGYRTGGTVHVIINNQVGFTTPALIGTVHPSTATDMAKSIQAPIFHVNGDDPEAVVRAARAGLRIPAGIQSGRRHRPGVLPPPRSQRGRRPVDDSADDVLADREEAHGPASSTPSRWSGSEVHHRRRGRPRRCKDYQSKLESAFAETKEAETGPVTTGEAFETLRYEPSDDRDASTMLRTAISSEMLATHR